MCLLKNNKVEVDTVAVAAVTGTKGLKVTNRATCSFLLCKFLSLFEMPRLVKVS